jgi:hypothetical protein
MLPGSRAATNRIQDPTDLLLAPYVSTVIKSRLPLVRKLDGPRRDLAGLSAFDREQNYDAGLPDLIAF